MFESIYGSPWVATFAVAVISFGGFAWWARGQSFLVAFVALFTLEILGDALNAGAWSPLRDDSPWKDAVALLFVLLGDFRYFLLVERFARRPTARAREATAWSAWGTAFGWMAIVPLTMQLLRTIAPARFAGRWSFATYEALILALVIGLRFLALPRRLAAAPPAVRAWLVAVTNFEIAQYALWLVADLIIMVGVDAGFALRLVPNVMYYGLFISFVAWRAPAEVKQ